jgi:hypothetical protein
MFFQTSATKESKARSVVADHLALIDLPPDLQVVLIRYSLIHRGSSGPRTASCPRKERSPFINSEGAITPLSTGWRELGRFDVFFLLDS